MDPKLPPLPPLPSLFDPHRPQDPIVATLLARRQQTLHILRSDAHGDAAETNHAEGADNRIQTISRDSADWGYEAASETQTRVFSWDTSHPKNESLGHISSSYLSEQLPRVVDVARGSLAREAMCQTLVMDSETLKGFFQYLVYGTSSQLFYWVDEVQLFKMNPRILNLSVEGMSRSSMRLIITRFLNIGSLLRRLEEFVLENRARKDAVLELHSIVHCTRVVTAYLRRYTTERLLSSQGLITDSIQYAEFEAILEFLGDRLDASIPYHVLPQTQKPLLDHVYLRSAHAVHSSPFRSLRAIAAYLLSETSSRWLDHVATALGMNNHRLERRGGPDDPIPVYHSWPSFVDEQSGLIIERGVKSLRLLRSGQPGHPACHARLFDTKSTKFEWVWTQEGVHNAVTSLASRFGRLQKYILYERVDSGSFNSTVHQNRTTINTSEPLEEHSSSAPSLDSTTYAAEIPGMAAFERQPGQYADDTVLEEAVESLAVTVGSFPAALPSAAPTVDRLGQLVIVEPLVAHSRLLSQALLDVFLNELHLLSHLDILYRFMLFGDPKFVANLRVALCDERPFPSESGGSSETQAPPEGASIGLGLNPKLSPTGEWPPSGFGLSHSLRSVIVEVLEVDPGESTAERVVKQEAEWRMGFVVPPVEDKDERERCHPTACFEHLSEPHFKKGNRPGVKAGGT
ncbi:hypothetical protein FRC01_003053 [Tulasnella sp. 417]|nr:hypothetical protein FRC01_003053 [Tulasnella sp. 417]